MNIKDYECSQVFKYNESSKHLIAYTYGQSSLEVNQNFNELENIEDDIKETVLMDFAHKLGIIFMENIFMVPNGASMYQIYYDRFIRKTVFRNVDKENVKKDFIKITDIDYIVDYIANFVNIWLANNHILTAVKKETIRELFGEGYFSFIYISALNYKNKIYLFYELTE